MFSKFYLKLALFVLVFAGASQAISQVAPAARGDGPPLAVGGGINYWDTDWGHSKMEGVTLWGDYYPNHLPTGLRGLGVEVQLRDVTFNKGDKADNFREATAGGGVIYSWRHFRNFHPYIKSEIAFGGLNFRLPPPLPLVTHTRTIQGR